MHLASKELTGLAMTSIMKDLQEWHGQLPDNMQIASLGRTDLTDTIRRSIYHVHLLYLGAIMLLYRRVALQYVRSFKNDQDRGGVWKPFETMLLSHAEQGVTAAKHSSRVLGLLMGEQGVFKRCWLVM